MMLPPLNSVGDLPPGIHRVGWDEIESRFGKGSRRWLTRSNYPAINGGHVKALQIPMPSIEQQTAIATILSDVDAELAALEARLAKTRALKQCMMQELLTGRTRLV